MKKITAANNLKVHDILLSSRLGLFPLKESMTLIKITQCPGCTRELKNVCSMVGHEGKQIVRIGVCTYCGYMGYIDRPSREWIVSFYSNEWDKEFMRTPEEMKQAVTLPRKGIKASRYAAFSLLEKLQVNKNKPFCDIGSGYGQMMKNFEQAGFAKVVGVENSTHREQAVRDVFGYTVVEGDFGNKKVTEELKKHGSFGLMFCHHVLEHVHNPNTVIEEMASLQEEGDYAIFALPDVAGEHINYVSFYLPHLHGFTKESLEQLFNRHGYELVVDGSPDILNIIMAFRKTAQPKAKLTLRNDYESDARKRFKNGLALDQLTQETYFDLKWEQKVTEIDTAQAVPASGGPAAAIFWKVRQLVAYVKSRWFKRLTGYYILLVTPEAKKLTSEETVEIQFNGPIQFLIK